jgi:hypothetical protein
VVDSTLNTTKAVTGGTGTDTIVFTASTNYATSATMVSGFETFRGSGAGASYNVASISGITAVQAQTTGGTVTFSGLTTQGVTVQNSITTLVTTLGNATGTADALTFTIDDADTTAAAITVGDISAASVETLNIVTADGLAVGTAHVVSDFDLSTSVTKLNISGNSALTLSDITDLASGAVVDASTFAHVLTVSTGVDAGDTIKGGTANDSITLAFASLGSTTTFAGGAGDDTVTVSGDGSDVVDADFAAMTGIDNLVITSATTTSVTMEGFAQGAIGALDFNSDGRMDVTAATLTTGGTINAGALLTKGVDVSATLTLASGLNATAALSISGGAIADTITVVVNDAADTGNDASTTSITGGGGIDVISYTAGTTGSGTNVLTLVSTATTVANADIVTGFVSALDKIDYNGALTNGAVTDDVANATLAGGIAAQAGYGAYIVTTNIADSGANTSGSVFATLLGSTAANLSTNFDALKAQLVASGGIFNGAITGLDAAIATDETALITLDNGTGSIVMRFTNTDATGNLVSASELQLVGVLTNTATLAAGDFV